MNKSQEQAIRNLFDYIIQDFEDIETVDVYWDSDWQQLREGWVGSYIRVDDLIEVVNKYKTLDLVAQALLNTEEE